LNVDFEARFASVTDALSKIERQTSRSVGQMSTAFGTLKGTLAGIGAGLSIGALSASFAGAVAELSELDDAAQKTGASVESLSSIFNTLAPTGVTMAEITDIAGKLTKAMAGAGVESSRAAAAFKAIGVSTKDASGNLRAVDDVLVDLAKALDGYADGSNKVALAQELLGKSGAAYLPLLKDLAQFNRENATVTAEQAAAAADLEDAWRKLEREGSILRQTLASKIIPTLLDITKGFNDARTAGLGFFDSLQAATLPDSRVAREVQGQITAIEKLNKARQAEIDLAKKNPDLRRDDSVLASIDAEIATRKKVIDTLQTRLNQLDKSRLSAASKDDPELARLLRGPSLADAPRVAGADNEKGKKQQLSDADRLYRRTLDQLFATQDLTREQQLALDVALEALPVQFRGAEQGAIAAARQADNLTAANTAAKALADTIKEATQAEGADNAALERLKNEARQSLEREVEGIKSLVDPTREVYKEIERVQQLLAFGLLPPDVGNARLMVLFSEVDGILQGVQTSVEEVKEAGRDIFAPIESSFESLLFSGAKARDVFAGLLEDIGKLILRQQLLSPFADFLGASFGGGDTSKIGIGTLFGKLLGRASGGPVTGGTPYIVGERGPELFVPGASGAIVPNGKFGRASGGVQIVQNITVDSRSDRASIVQAMQAAKQAAIAEIRDSMNRGGQFA
jgi:hypothetical protein